MSTPVATAVPDRAPAVPPPSSRKPTASEKADSALALIADLDRKIEQAFETHPDLSSNVHGGLTAKQSEQLSKVADLDRDLSALVSAFNEQAENVDRLANAITGPAERDPAAADQLEKLREDVRATLAELRAAEPGSPDGDRARFDEVANALEHIRQEQGSYGRAVDALTSRLDQLSTGVDNSTRPAYAPSVPRPGVPGVLRKVLELQRLVPELDKDKQASQEMGGYGFRSIDSAMDAVGNGIRTVGLILRTEIVSSDNKQFQVGTRLWTSVTVRARYVFIDPDDGSEHALEMVGEGRDLGDKATSKAVSMAMKYGILQGLCIPFRAVESDGNSTPPVDTESEEAQAYRRQQHAEREQQRAEQQGRQVEQQARAEQPPADAPPAPEPPDDRTPEEKAAAVVVALERLNEFPLSEAQRRFDRIAVAATTQGLTGYIVSGSNIALHLTVHRNLLRNAAQSAGVLHQAESGRG